MEKTQTISNSDTDKILRLPEMGGDPKGISKGHHISNLNEKLNKVDKIGASISTLCAIHCFLTPIALFLLPTWQDFFHHHEIHIFFFLFVAPIAGFSFYKTFKAHKNKRPLIKGVIGLIFLAIPLLAHEISVFGHYFSLLGSLFLISAHLESMRCRCHHQH